MDKRVFIIKGAKYFDKVNGNTYNSVMVLDVNNNNSIKLGYCYGYGRDYYYRAVEQIKDLLHVSEIDWDTTKIYDMGAEYMTKKRVRNFDY